jgi:hypothetical protein
VALIFLQIKAPDIPQTESRPILQTERQATLQPLRSVTYEQVEGTFHSKYGKGQATQVSVNCCDLTFMCLIRTARNYWWN